jgi:hypothetical protein
VEYVIEGDIVSSIFKLIHSVVCAKGCSHT